MEVEGLAPGDGALPEGEGAFAEGLWRVAGFGEGGADTAGVTGQLAAGSAAKAPTELRRLSSRSHVLVFLASCSSRALHRASSSRHCRSCLAATGRGS